MLLTQFIMINKSLKFNTFIQYIRATQYKQLGFYPNDENDRMFKPVHWFQFADDAADVTSGEKDNQLLLSCLTGGVRIVSIGKLFNKGR